MASDLIRKSRTLELLKYYERQYDGIGRAIRAFEQMETVDRWIPCSERLPKQEGMYLITSNLFGSLEVQYVFYSENVQMFVCNGTPVAWMPLPEPYKAGDIDG